MTGVLAPRRMPFFLQIINWSVTVGKEKLNGHNYRNVKDHELEWGTNSSKEQDCRAVRDSLNKLHSVVCITPSIM